MDGWVDGHAAAEGHVCPKQSRVLAATSPPDPHSRTGTMQSHQHSPRDPNQPHSWGRREHLQCPALAAPCPSQAGHLRGHREPCPQPGTLQQIQLRGPGPHTRELEELLQQQHFHTHTSAAENSPEKGNQFPAQPSPQSSTKPAQTLFSPARLPPRLLSKTGQIRFPSPHQAWLEGDGNRFHPQCHPPVTPSQGMCCRQEG